jgi:hypothetical protein
MVGLRANFIRHFHPRRNKNGPTSPWAHVTLARKFIDTTGYSIYDANVAYPANYGRQPCKEHGF